MAGIRRGKGTAQRGKKPIVERLPDSLQGVRDRALLLVGFAGAFRRSELVALEIPDLEFTRDGLVVTIRRSKTDQEGQGRRVGIPYGLHPETCPVRAAQNWLDLLDQKSGPYLRPIDRPGHRSVTTVRKYIREGSLSSRVPPGKWAYDAVLINSLQRRLHKPVVTRT